MFDHKIFLTKMNLIDKLTEKLIVFSKEIKQFVWSVKLKRFYHYLFDTLKWNPLLFLKEIKTISLTWFLKKCQQNK